MLSKVILVGSAVFLGLCGIALSFLPKEILLFMQEDPSPIVLIVAQLMGSLYLSLAVLNWMSRAKLVGGIYNRPLALINLLHFFMSALVLIKSPTTFSNSPALLVLCILYIVFAIAFFKLIFTTPSTVANN